jgi:AraC-like DNA-binding protein
MKINTTIMLPYSSELPAQIDGTDPSTSPVLKALVECHGHITREAAAHLMGISASHFSHVFKKEQGVSFRCVQQSVKMQVAAQYLKHTSMRISDIASKLHYSELGKFEKAFKAFHRESPSAYRRNQRQHNRE